MVKNNKLNRRSLLKSAALASGVTATGSLATPSILAKSPIVIKMQTSWPDSDIWMNFANEYRVRVEEMSNKRITFDLMPAGEVVAAHQVMDAVSEGILDAAHSVPLFWSNKHKAALFFGMGPFWGGSATSMLSWFYQGGGIQLYNELTQEILELDIYGFLGFPMFAQPFGWFKNEVNSLKDINGLRYRAVGLTANLMQSLGLYVSQLSSDEIQSAMERGVLDAFEYNNPSTDSKFGAQDIAKNYYLSSFHQASDTFEFLFNKDFFDDLDPDLQAIVKYAVEAVSTSNTALAMREYSSDLKKLEEEHEVSIHRTSKSILNEQLSAWQDIIDELNSDEFTERLIESQREWVKQVSYFEIMNAPDYELAYNFFFPDKLNL